MQQADGVLQRLMRLKFHHDPRRARPRAAENRSAAPSAAPAADRRGSRAWPRGRTSPAAAFATGPGACQSTTRSRRDAGENKSAAIASCRHGPVPLIDDDRHIISSRPQRRFATLCAPDPLTRPRFAREVARSASPSNPRPSMDMLNPYCGIDRDPRGVVRLTICNAGSLNILGTRRHQRRSRRAGGAWRRTGRFARSSSPARAKRA